MNSWAWFALGAFLCGSIPSGLLIARAKGLDIRQHGSKNIGATNVMRVMGRGPGLVCFTLDALKGLAPTLGAGLYHGVAGALRVPTTQAWFWMAVMAAAILGHIFSPWVGFKGGKGVATGLGALLGVWPALAIPGLVALALWIIVFAWHRYVSLASIVGALALPLLVLAQFRLVAPRSIESGATTGWSRGSGPFLIVVGSLCLLVVWRHRANIRRLIQGQELRVHLGRRTTG
jgi:acyl phosphate:glycerol-3-phosphate acyltransferase